MAIYDNQNSFPNACLYDSLVWGDSNYINGALAFIASLKSVGSRFGLVVLIPRSSLSRNFSVKHPMKGYINYQLFFVTIRPPQ